MQNKMIKIKFRKINQSLKIQSKKNGKIEENRLIQNKKC